MSATAKLKVALNAAVDRPVNWTFHRGGSADLSEPVLEAVGRWMAAYHALTGAPVTKLAFENALVQCAKAADLHVSTPASATHPGWDLRLAGKRISCKTEAGQAMRDNALLISKLMECAWSKPFSSREQFAASVPRILRHLDQYDCILMLRAFRREAVTTYKLVEIPVSLLRRIEHLRPEQFSPVTAAGSTSATVRTATGQSAFRLAFDGSDNKVQIRSLRSDLCLPLATWTVPALELSL